MIKTENFPNAYREVYIILNYVEEELLNKIPKDFIDMLENKMNREYEYKYNEKLDFEEQEILQETKVVFAYIFLNYWSTKDENNLIMKKFRQDIMLNEKNKPQYNQEELFKNKKEKTIEETKEKQMIEYKKENIFTRILRKIKNIFRIRK